MKLFQVGNIVRASNGWLNSLLNIHDEIGVVTNTNEYSSTIYLFISKQEIILLNDYVEEVGLKLKKNDIKVGDLVELKPKVRKIINISGPGLIIKKTIISTTNFDHDDISEQINAYIIYFHEHNAEYTIPIECLRLFD